MYRIVSEGSALPTSPELLVARRTGVVGGQETSITIAVVHVAQVGRARHDVVVRVVGIGTEGRVLHGARHTSGASPA